MTLFDPWLTESVNRLRELENRPASEQSGPRLGIILGSGLGGFADAISDARSLAYADLPGLPPSTAVGHRGQFLVGKLGKTPVIAMAGRLHAYEGHPLETVTRPVSIMAALGLNALVVSCAAGALNPDYAVGDLVILHQHMSWLNGKLGAVAGPIAAVNNPAGLPLRRAATCDDGLAAIAARVSRRNDFALHRGTYLAVQGPTYETRAECRMMRFLGVDVVGMSTVPELVVAANSGVRTLGVAVVTNLAIPDSPVTADHADVLAASSRAGEKLSQIIHAIVESL